MLIVFWRSPSLTLAWSPEDIVSTETKDETELLDESAELQELRQRFNGRRVFLYMGRIATEKNVEALLRAWRLVQPAGCTLVVVGDGPVRTSLMQTYGSEIGVL